MGGIENVVLRGAGLLGAGAVASSVAGGVAGPLLNAIPSITGPTDTVIGKILGATTSANSNIPYLWGGNTTAGMDCSHWCWNDTKNAMIYINEKAGGPNSVYDMNFWGPKLTPPAASMIQQVAAVNGRYSRTDIDCGHLPPGTLIGVDRGQGIIHVAQVALDAQGNLCISESGGSQCGAGVHLMRYEDWMRTHRSAELIATNPFLLKDEKKKELLQEAVSGQHGSRGILKVEASKAGTPAEAGSSTGTLASAASHIIHKGAELLGLS